MKSPIWRPSKAKFQKIVSDCSTIKEILAYFGLQNGSSTVTLKKRFKRDNIDHSHIPTGRYANIGRRNVKISNKDLFKANSTHSGSTVKTRVIKENLIPYKCEACDAPPMWLDKPLTLRLDHRNGINNDHRLSNLRFLCPNCDSQTDTYGGRNIDWGEKHKHNCQCGKKITKYCKTGLCMECRNKHRISKEDLAELVWVKPTTEIAKDFGVSDKAVAKWCKKFNISKPGMGYWSKKRRGCGEVGSHDNGIVESRVQLPPSPPNTGP